MHCKIKRFLVIKLVHPSKSILSRGCDHIFTNAGAYLIITRNINFYVPGPLRWWVVGICSNTMQIQMTCFKHWYVITIIGHLLSTLGIFIKIIWPTCSTLTLTIVAGRTTTPIVFCQTLVGIKGLEYPNASNH